MLEQAVQNIDAALESNQNLIGHLKEQRAKGKGQGKGAGDNYTYYKGSGPKGSKGGMESMVLVNAATHLAPKMAVCQSLCDGSG